MTTRPSRFYLLRDGEGWRLLTSAQLREAGILPLRGIDLGRARSVAEAERRAQRWLRDNPGPAAMDASAFAAWAPAANARAVCDAHRGTLDANAQYFGGHVLPSGTRYGYTAGVAADFGFTGVAFVPAGWFSRLPDGTEIVEAYALVRATGLQACSWSQVFELQPDGTLHLEYTRDDAYITYDGPVSGVGGSLSMSTGTPAGASGSVGLALVGRRRNSRMVQLVGGGTHLRNSDDWVHLGSGIAISAAESGKYKKVSVKEMLQKLIVNRNAVFAEYELWPTIAGVEPGDSEGALASYLKGLMPAASATLIAGSAGTWGYASEQSGRYAVMSTALSISAIKCRFRLPSGILADDVIATPQSAMIAGWS